MSQNAEVLRLLRSAGRLGITPAFALERIGTMRLAARIAELRSDGHRIDTTYVTSPTRGRTARYARYVLQEPATTAMPSVTRGTRVHDEMREGLDHGAEVAGTHATLDCDTDGLAVVAGQLSLTLDSPSRARDAGVPPDSASRSARDAERVSIG